MIDEFLKKFPEKIYFYVPKKEGDQFSDKVELHSIPTVVASYFSIFREQVIRHWNLENDMTDHLGSQINPFNVEHLDIDIRSLNTVSKLLGSDHESVTLLTPDEVYVCDDVVKKLCLDKFRSTYFHRSRQNDQTHGTYKIKVVQETKLSLSEENVSRKDWFKNRIVIVKERWKGATHCAFEYVLPKEVLAVKRMWI